MKQKTVAELRRKSKENVENRANWPAETSFQNWEVATEVEKHKSTYLNMMTQRLSQYYFLIQNTHMQTKISERVLTWVASLSCVVFILKLQGRLFSACHFPAQKLSVVSMTFMATILSLGQVSRVAHSTLSKTNSLEWWTEPAMRGQSCRWSLPGKSGELD